MKLAAGRVEGFLRRPDPEIRAVLLYGPDAGLVRERAEALLTTPQSSYCCNVEGKRRSIV